MPKRLSHWRWKDIRCCTCKDEKDVRCTFFAWRFIFKRCTQKIYTITIPCLFKIKDKRYIRQDIILYTYMYKRAEDKKIGAEKEKDNTQYCTIEKQELQKYWIDIIAVIIYSIRYFYWRCHIVLSCTIEEKEKDIKDKRYKKIKSKNSKRCNTKDKRKRCTWTKRCTDVRLSTMYQYCTYICTSSCRRL